MIFSSYVFVFLFLPVVTVVYFALSKMKSPILQHTFLLVSSLVFYGWFNPSYLIIILSSIFINFLLAKGMMKLVKVSMRKLIFIIGILFNIGMLGYYKYYDFFIENVNTLFSTDLTLQNIVLPLGISFFTFQQFSFLISVYKKEEKVSGLLEYGMFVAFFPQLVAGPIMLYTEMIPQFKEEEKRYINWENMAIGIKIFIRGMAKKLLIADTISPIADYVFNNPGGTTTLQAWVGAISYMLQIYFDFSGYSDMAVGLGKMFNIDLVNNFDSPYKSVSIREFWRRWHITLGRALTQYIYIPLGGNRKGLPRTLINLMATFLVSGLWHGAGWQFIIWGGLHGLALCFERVTEKRLKRIPNIVHHITVLFFLLITWVFFRAETVTDAIAVIQNMFTYTGGEFTALSLMTVNEVISLPGIISSVTIVIMIISLTYIVLHSKNVLEIVKENNIFTNKGLVGYTVLLLLCIICMSRVSPFIYFNF